MDYLKTNIKWEEFFIQEAISLEEKLNQNQGSPTKKSKIRTSLESKILDWEKYATWATENLGCCSLKKNIDPEILKKLSQSLAETYETYSNYKLWSEDLIPTFVWEEQVYIFGLEYNTKLSELKNHVFILTPPEILTYLSNYIPHNFDSAESENVEENSNTGTVSNIEGLDLDIKPSNLDFKNIAVELNTTQTQTNAMPDPDVTAASATSVTAQPVSAATVNDENMVWEFIKERHEENSFEVKKQFNAYIVLKVTNNYTEVFKMDEELKRNNINDNIFKYSLDDGNPFARVYSNGMSDCFSLSQLGITILNYKYACITALKRNDKVVGFLIGLKSSNLSEKDKNLLEDIASETAA